MEVAWDVLTAISDWPHWNAEIKSAEISGPVAPGTTFRWKTGPGTIKSTIEAAERPHVIAWTGRSLGISAIHVWRLDRTDRGTRVQTEESMEGIPARLLRASTQKTLDTSLERWLQAMKIEAERRSS